jgi:hypothetical protein
MILRVITPSLIVALNPEHDPLDPSSDSGRVQITKLLFTDDFHSGPRRVCGREERVVLCQVEYDIDKFDWNAAKEGEAYSLDVFRLRVEV